MQPPPLVSLTRDPTELPQELLDEYEPLTKDPLGIGAFAVVRLLRHRKSGDLFALKIIEKHPLRIRNMMSQMQREVRIQKQLNHPNILKLVRAVEDQGYSYMLLEYCPKGQLRAHVGQQPEHRLTEDKAAHYFAQIVCGVEWMHRNSCVHRDLKLENMLLTENDVVKICDFGWSAEMEVENSLKTTCGTTAYWAPEIWQGQAQDESVDLWSLGCLLYEVLAGHPPFWGHNQEELKQKAVTSHFGCPPWFSPEACDIVRKLLRPDPKERIRCADLLRHEWLSKNAPATTAEAYKRFETTQVESMPASATAPAPAPAPVTQQPTVTALGTQLVLPAGASIRAVLPADARPAGASVAAVIPAEALPAATTRQLVIRAASPLASGANQAPASPLLHSAPAGETPPPEEGRAPTGVLSRRLSVVATVPGSSQTAASPASIVARVDVKTAALPNSVQPARTLTALPKQSVQASAGPPSVPALLLPGGSSGCWLPAESTPSDGNCLSARRVGVTPVPASTQPVLLAAAPAPTSGQVVRHAPTAAAVTAGSTADLSGSSGLPTMVLQPQVVVSAATMQDLQRFTAAAGGKALSGMVRVASPPAASMVRAPAALRHASVGKATMSSQEVPSSTSFRLAKVPSSSSLTAPHINRKGCSVMIPASGAPGASVLAAPAGAIGSPPTASPAGIMGSIKYVAHSQCPGHPAGLKMQRC
mmetsp:Transcript_58251/g.107540  ORF Transcript_58251/g.107540 Transcript_58251/m.107540 type:complete len:704 (-) Transcript_58251:46-2157(-)